MDPEYIDIAKINIGDIEDIDISDIDDIDDDIAENRPVIRGYIRDRQNPFEQYDEDEFERRYRFRKDSRTLWYFTNDPRRTCEN